MTKARLVRHAERTVRDPSGCLSIAGVAPSPLLCGEPSRMNSAVATAPRLTARRSRVQQEGAVKSAAAGATPHQITEEVMAKIEMRCETAECVTAIAKYGEHYHSVHSVLKAPGHQPEATAMCERCGGYHDGTKWSHVCKLCKTTVEAGKLTGFFVPHRCADCDAKLVAAEKASGRVCRRCNSVMSYCCC